MYDKLNIYSINDTINQKKYITNIQNNLHAVYNTPVYKNLVKELEILDNVCFAYVSNKLVNNDDKINKNITNKIIEDVIYNNIYNNLDTLNLNIINNTVHDINNDSLYNQLNKVLKHYIKDERIENLILKFIGDIDYILNSFKLHNTYSDKFLDKNSNEFTGVFKAYSFGCTSSVYLLNNIIVKVYNDNLRWKRIDHDLIDEIYERELKILKKIDYLIDNSLDRTILAMKYMGESLYDNFVLPGNWKEQINNLFINLTTNGIYYPEFNLNNIVVLNDVISFVDYGLAYIDDLNKINNKNNCDIFIKLLDILNEKFIKVTEIKNRHILYNKFMNNIRINKMYELNIF